MTNKYDHLTEAERLEWETSYIAIMAMNQEIETAIEKLKLEISNVFKEAKE